MTFFYEHRIATLLFLTAVCMRLLFALPYLTAPHLSGAVISADGYYEIAENLLHHNGFSRNPLGGEMPIPDSVRMPLYPLLIALIVGLTGSYKIFMLIQIIAGGFIPILARKITWILTSNETIAFLSALFLALEPLNAWLPSILLTETMFTLFFLASCIFFLSYLNNKKISQLALCALTLGVATLIRPTTQFFPVLVVILLFMMERGNIRSALKYSAAFLIIFYLTLAPWEYRNYIVFGTPALSVQSTSILYAYFVPSVIALEEHISFSDAQQKFTGSQTLGGIEDVNLGNTSIYKKLALTELKNHPLGIIKSLWTTFYAFFTNDGYRTFTPNYKLLSFDASDIGASQILKQPNRFLSLLLSPGMLLIVFGRIMWIVITVLSFGGLYLFMRDKKYSIDSLFVLLTPLYFLATTAIVGLAVNGRFRIPVDVFIVMLAAYLCRHILRFYRNREYKNISP